MTGAPQTAAARQSAEAELRALIEEFAPANLALVETVRKWLRKRLPSAHEVVYEYRDCFVISYSPSGHGYEGVFALRGSAKGVLLYFNQSKDLPDRANVLQGSGKQARFINLDGKSTLAHPEFVSLVDEALARNTVPYAPNGNGSVVVRSTSAKKRRQVAPSKKEPS